MQCCRFATDQRPWCVWDWDLKRLSATFLDTFDPTYFDYIVNLHETHLSGEHAKYAATAIRTTYCHAMETLFALLAALVQAPECVPGWIQKYRSQDLDQVVAKIAHGHHVYSKVKCERLTWAALVQLTMGHVTLEDKETEQLIKSGFEKLWTRLAHEFLSERNRAEYNSIKHGFRVNSAGSIVAVSIEETPGVACAAGKMKILEGSEHGSSFYEPKQLAKHNVWLKRRSVNWYPVSLVGRVQLIVMSLRNIVSFLKIFVGTASETVEFCWPDELDAFEEVWKGPTLLDVSFDTTIESKDIYPRTPEEILAVYVQPK